jgi:Phage Tail Collar Domain
MKFAAVALASCSMLIGAAGVVRAADAPAARVGEVRSFIVDTTDSSQIAALHHDGWIEARGQVVAVRALPELFKAVGRTWTGRRVAEGRFSVPDFDGRRDSVNPFGVLGPGDLVTSGLPHTPRNMKTSWIFAGRDVSDALGAR